MLVDLDDSEAPPAPAPRAAPVVCGVRSWPLVGGSSTDVDLSVVPTPSGTVVLLAERGGGPLRGLVLDDALQITGDPSGVVMRHDVPFSAASAALVDGELISAAVAGDEIQIDRWRPDLSDHEPLVAVAGRGVTKPAIARYGARLGVPLAGPDGFETLMFDADWRFSERKGMSSTEPAAIAMAQFRGDLVTAWSDGRACHFHRMGSSAEPSMPVACDGVRLAINEDKGVGLMTYIGPGGELQIADLQLIGGDALLEPRALRPAASSPRIVRADGSLLWLAYRDPSGTVNVGFTRGGDLRELRLDLHVAPAAYELVAIDGKPWVFALDGNGLSATQLCAVAPADE